MRDRPNIDIWFLWRRKLLPSGKIWRRGVHGQQREGRGREEQNECPCTSILSKLNGIYMYVFSIILLLLTRSKKRFSNTHTAPAVIKQLRSRNPAHLSGARSAGKSHQRTQQLIRWHRGCHFCDWCRRRGAIGPSR